MQPEQQGIHLFPFLMNQEQYLQLQARSWVNSIGGAKQGDRPFRVPWSNAGQMPMFHALKQELKQVGKLPLLLQPPAGWDSRAGAMAEAAAQLEEAGLLNGEAKTFFELGSWADKQACISTSVEQHRDRIVVLCEDPNRWLQAADEEHHNSTVAAHEFLFGFLDAGVSLVFSGSQIVGLRSTTLPRFPHGEMDQPAPSSTLADGAAWGELSPIASELAKRDPFFVGLTFRQLRLLVALAFLTSSDEATYQLKQGATVESIAEKVRNAVVTKGGILARTLRKLAEVRRPFEVDLEEKLLPPSLDAPGRDLFRRCLLDRWNGCAILTNPLRPTRELYTSQDREIHFELWQLYQQAAGAGKVMGRLAEMEAIFHGVAAQDPHILNQVKPIFTDQLDALGRAISQRGKRLGQSELFKQAANAFRTSIQYEDENDYAHHYLAYNLDYQGIESDQVERHYRRALEINNRHAWWHSRWICYLITRGRTADARKAWLEALEALDPSIPSNEVYASVHLWVARLLIHRGQLDFARTVLEGVPTEIREQDTRFASVQRLLDHLSEASHSRAVFPVRIPPAARWNGPHLCSLRNERGLELTRWVAARVEAVDEEGVQLRVGIPPGTESGSEPRFGDLTLSIEKFDACSRDERAAELKSGRFLELAFYGNDTEPTIRVHRSLPWVDPDLPALDPPDSARYLRSAGMIT